MREGIHPEYHQATVTCAIRSTQDSRRQHRHAAVLTSSTKNTVLNKKKRQSRLRWEHLSLFY